METKQENVIPTDYAEVMQKSYIDYAMSVIISRALPDVRDGLKPVQRRTLYDMYELGIRYDRPYRKCAQKFTVCQFLNIVYLSHNGYFLSLSIPLLIITASFLLSLFLIHKTSDKTLLLHQL